MPLTGHANIDDPQQEVVLTDIISGLRKERIVIEEPEPSLNVDVLPDEPPIDQPLPPLSQAVEDFYLMAIESNEPLSAVGCRPSEEIESDIEIWLYAVIARYNNMDGGERILFELKFRETLDPVFSGRFLVHDVYVGLRYGEGASMSTKG